MADSGRFILLDVIGCGGHGTVHRARFEGEGGFQKEVAIKLLKTSSQDDPELERRLRDEARILGLLHHRAIVGVDRLTRVEGRWAVIMEFVQGEDLSALFARGPMPASVALAICVEIASAISAAYNTLGHDGRPLRLLHRDLKPSNVRLSPDGSVKVLDFGIARAEFTHRESHTRSIAVGGTDGYMSPERLDGVADSPSGDVYAVGVILVELLLGERLGKAFGRPERHMGLVRSTLDALDAAGLPPDVVKLAGELLDYEPTARPTVAELERRAEDLARRVEGPSLKAWARRHVRVAGLPPPSAPLDTEGALRSGAILSEGDLRSEQGTIWLAGADRLIERYLQERPQTPARARTPTATLQPRPPPPPLPFTLALPQRPEYSEASPLPWDAGAASVERPAPPLDRTASVERPVGPREPSSPLKAPPRPQTRRLAVPIVAVVVIALALVGAVALTWLEGGPGPGEAPPGPTGGGGEGVGGAGVVDPPIEEPPEPGLVCAPDKDLDGHGQRGGATAQPGVNCPAGWVTLADDCDDERSGVAPGAPERCDGRDNDCDGRTDEGFEDLNSNGKLDCLETSPAANLKAQDRSRWLRSGLVLEATIPKGCAPRARVQLQGSTAWRASAELKVQDGPVRCGVPVTGARPPEGATSCGLGELSQADLASETATIEWRCCFEDTKSEPGKGQRAACYTVGSGVVTQPY